LNIWNSFFSTHQQGYLTAGCNQVKRQSDLTDRVGMLWLAVSAVVFSVVGAFYYLRVVKLMYFDEPVTGSPIDVPADFRAVISLNGIMMLGLGVFSGSLIPICMSAF